MASNAQDDVVVQFPETALAEASTISIDDVQTPNVEAAHDPVARLREKALAALRSWRVGRKAWDRVVAWMAAIRAARGSTASQAPHTGD